MAATNKAREAWTKREREYALKHYGPKTAAEIGRKINKSEHAVRKYINRYDAERLGK